MLFDRFNVLSLMLSTNLPVTNRFWTFCGHHSQHISADRSWYCRGDFTKTAITPFLNKLLKLLAWKAVGEMHLFEGFNLDLELSLVVITFISPQMTVKIFNPFHVYLSLLSFTYFNETVYSTSRIREAAQLSSLYYFCQRVTLLLWNAIIVIFHRESLKSHCSSALHG